MTDVTQHGMSQAPHDLPAAFDRFGRPGRRRFVSGACAAALLAFAAAGRSRAPFGMGRAFAAILWHLQHTDGELSLWLSEMPRPRDT